jgi:rare lipoprotein A
VGPAPLLGPEAGVRVARAKPPPPAPAATVMAAATALPKPVSDLPPAVEAVQMASLAPPAPVTSAALPPLAGPPAARDIPVTNVSDPSAGVLGIQAGAFATEANAEKAVAQLSATGRAVIEPVSREGGTLYKVYLPAPTDELQAYALRDRVAEIGFADARVVHSFQTN